MEDISNNLRVIGEFCQNCNPSDDRFLLVEVVVNVGNKSLSAVVLEELFSYVVISIVVFKVLDDCKSQSCIALLDCVVLVFWLSSIVYAVNESLGGGRIFADLCGTFLLL